MIDSHKKNNVKKIQRNECGNVSVCTIIQKMVLALTMRMNNSKSKSKSKNDCVRASVTILYTVDRKIYVNQ